MARRLLYGLLLLGLCVPAFASDTVYTSPPLSQSQRGAFTRSLDRRWESFQKKLPNLCVRELFAFALDSAEADYRLDRIDGALAIAEEMQDVKDPNTRTYGNFKWYWKSEKPEDLNAVEFSMQDAALLWMRHRDRLPAEARERLERLIKSSIEGIHRHNVSDAYTNIFLMKAWNCIALGENTGRPDLAREGYALLDAWLLYTWENGVHEYVSPTYYGTDLDSLMLIAKFAQQERGRRQAEAALRYFWTDIAANWFEPGKRLSGSHSRDYDYVTGHGYLDNHLWRVGWLEAKPEWVPTHFAALAEWPPPAELRKLALPRMVRQRWSSQPGDRSANWVGRSIALGTAGATYGGAMDKPLSVVFAGGDKMPMVNFFMDARNDPFGKNREETGGGHMKAFHVVSFLMGVQREREALFLTTTSPEDADFKRYTKTPTCLLSQLVLPRDGVTAWIGEEQSNLTKEVGAKPVQLGQPVFVRCGDAVAGFRVVHAVNMEGGPAAIELKNDGNKLGAMTLTVTHSPAKPGKGRASVALWTRVAEGLDDAGFAQFRRDFAQAEAKAVLEGPILDVTASGLRLKANIEKQERLACEGDDPGAADLLLAVDGKDLGREALQDVEPIAKYRRVLESPNGEGALTPDRPFEIENAALIIPPFEVGEDPAASGGKFAWMPGKPGEPGGDTNARAVIPVRVPTAGAYYLWARILTPTPSDDSFFFRIRQGSKELLPRTDWHTGTHTSWAWSPVELGAAKQRAITLPAGVVLLEVICREDGSKMDQIVLTPDADRKP